MDPPEQVLALIRDSLGCNGARNFFDFGQLRQATLEKRIGMASKKLTSLNKVSLCVVWLVERMIRTNKAARSQVVEEWVNYESCLNYRSDSVGSSSIFKEEMRAVEDEIVRHMDLARTRCFRRGTTTAEGRPPLFSQEQDSPKRRDIYESEKRRGQHYSPSRSRRPTWAKHKERSRRDSREGRSPRKNDSSSPKKLEDTQKIKREDSFSDLKGPPPALPLGNVHTLTGLLNHVYDKQKVIVDRPFENLVSRASGHRDDLRLDCKARRSISGDQPDPKDGQRYGASSLSTRFSAPTNHIENSRLLAAKSFGPDGKLSTGGSQIDEHDNCNLFLDPYENQPAELPGIASEEITSVTQSPLEPPNSAESGEAADTPSSSDSGIRQANEFLSELIPAQSQKRKYQSFDDDECMPGAGAELASKRARGTQPPGEARFLPINGSNEDSSANDMKPAHEPRKALYHPFIAAVKRVYGGVFRNKPERKTALEIWDETESAK